VFRAKPRDPLRNAIETLYKVRLLGNRLESLVDRITERRNALFERMVELQSRNEKYLSKKYAEEIARLDKLASRLTTIRLVVEKIDLSLQYAINMREFNDLSKELTSLVSELKKLPESNLPELNMIMMGLEESVREMAEISHGGGGGISFNVDGSSQDVRRILEVAREVMKKKLEVDLTV
jgi:division protein CdvB (Snf7/Vps24/ESCRT-III family)